MHYWAQAPPHTQQKLKAVLVASITARQRVVANILQLVDAWQRAAAV